MKYASDTPVNNPLDRTANDLFKRLSVLGFGLFAYVAGCVGLFWFILGLGGLAPVSLSEWQAATPTGAVLTNLGLILLFGVQHTVMARPWFKDKLVKIIPQAAERASFMLMSGIVTVFAIYFWQPLPGTVWQIDNSIAQIALWSLYALAWAYLLLATFVTNHFELMGLRQVYLYFRQIPYRPLPFTRKFMYRYSRHPMMLGFLIGMWSIPVMSVTHFCMATLFSLYIAVGIFFEERDLIKNFGDTYRRYKQDIATFIPRLF